MHKYGVMALGLGLLIGVTGCSDDADVHDADPDVHDADVHDAGVDVPDGDKNEAGTGGPQVEFDPAAKVIPFPNDRLLDPVTGLVNLPAPCNESATSKALREQVLNKLDGFGTYEVGIQATFTEPVDQASLKDRVVLYKRATVTGTATEPVDPATAKLVPVLLRTATTARASADCGTTAAVSAVQIIPLVPLDQKSVYTVGLLSGIKTATGKDFGPSPTWAQIPALGGAGALVPRRQGRETRRRLARVGVQDADDHGSGRIRRSPVRPRRTCPRAPRCRSTCRRRTSIALRRRTRPARRATTTRSAS